MTQLTAADIAERAAIDAACNRGEMLIARDFDDTLYSYAMEMVRAAVAAALYLKLRQVTFVLDSPGGDLAVLHRFVGAIQLFRSDPDFRFVGHVRVRAMSACFHLLQHRDWRTAHPGSQLMLHYGARRLPDHAHLLYHSGVAAAFAAERDALASGLQRYRLRSGLSLDHLHEMHATDRYLTPCEALELGLLDEIVDPLPVRSRRPDYRLTKSCLSAESTD